MVASAGSAARGLGVRCLARGFTSAVLPGKVLLVNGLRCVTAYEHYVRLRVGQYAGERLGEALVKKSSTLLSVFTTTTINKRPKCMTDNVAWIQPERKRNLETGTTTRRG